MHAARGGSAVREDLAIPGVDRAAPVEARSACGRIEVERAPGRGSLFCVRLPAAAAVRGLAAVAP